MIGVYIYFIKWIINYTIKIPTATSSKENIKIQINIRPH